LGGSGGKGGKGAVGAIGASGAFGAKGAGFGGSGSIFIILESVFLRCLSYFYYIVVPALNKLFILYYLAGLEIEITIKINRIRLVFILFYK